MVPQMSTLISGSMFCWKKAGLGGWPVSSIGTEKMKSPGKWLAARTGGPSPLPSDIPVEIIVNRIPPVAISMADVNQRHVDFMLSLLVVDFSFCDSYLAYRMDGN